jgi:hypothetical protein
MASLCSSSFQGQPWLQQIMLSQHCPSSSAEVGPAPLIVWWQSSSFPVGRPVSTVESLRWKVPALDAVVRDMEPVVQEMEPVMQEMEPVVEEMGSVGMQSCVPLHCHRP